MTLLLAAPASTFPGIYLPTDSPTTRFSGHHRYKDPTWFNIPTAGYIQFPLENTDSKPHPADKENIFSEIESQKTGEKANWGSESADKLNVSSSSEASSNDGVIADSLNKEKNGYRSDASSLDDRNSEDLDRSNTQVIVDLQSNYDCLPPVCASVTVVSYNCTMLWG